MNLLNLPDNITIKIIRFLPYQQRVRVGRVNQQFRRISNVLISETKSLQLQNSIFDNLAPDSFEKLVTLCCRNLQHISFPFSKNIGAQLAEIFANFSCPRLLELGLPSFENLPEIFPQLMRNNRNLKYLTIYLSDDRTTFPADVLNENLEQLVVWSCYNSIFVESLIDRCPNLTHLRIGFSKNPGGYLGILDRFLASCPKLSILHLFPVGIANIHTPLDLLSVSSFWNLSELTYLAFQSPVRAGTEDAVLAKIAASFPKLTTISITRVTATVVGIRSLNALSNLSEISVLSVGNIDDGLRRLAESGRLEHVWIPKAEICGLILKTFLCRNPKLRRLDIAGIEVDETSEDLASVIRSIDVPFKIQCEIFVYSSYIWLSDEVVAAFKELRDNRGHILAIKF